MKSYSRQPQVKPKINWSNPLTKGLNFVAIGGIPINLVNNRVGTNVSGVTITGERGGRAFRTIANASNNNRLDFTVPLDTGGSGYTFASIMVHSYVGAFQYLIMRELAGISGGSYNILMGVNGSKSLQISFGTNGLFTSSTLLSDNVWYTLSGSTPPNGDTNQSNGKLFINGIKETSFLSGNAGGTVSASTQTNVHISGRPSDANRQLNGAQALTVSWNRILSDAEHREFARNPWAIFSFEDKTVYSIPSGNTTTNQNITGKARIQATANQVETGKARIQTIATKVETGLARIQKVVDQVETGVARITATTVKIETGLARIQVTVNQTVTGVANIVAATGTTNQNITGVSRIQATTVRTETGLSRIQVTTNRTITGVARISGGGTTTTPLTQYNIEIGAGISQSLSPTGNMLEIEIVTSTPTDAPVNGKGVVFMVSGGTVTIYVWSGSAWIAK